MHGVLVENVCRCAEELTSAGKIMVGRVVYSNAVENLQQLISEEGYQKKCESCPAKGFKPVIVYFDLEKLFWWVSVGDTGRGLSDEAIFPVDRRIPGLQFRRFDQYNDFKKEVMAILRERCDHFVTFLNDRQKLAQEWRECGSSLLAAARIVLSGNISGMRILAASEKHIDTETLEALVGSVQSRAWLMMSFDWLNFEDVSSIEADLKKYIDNVPLLGNSVDQFFAMLASNLQEEVIRETASPLMLSHYYAIIVSILQRAGREPDRGTLDKFFSAWLMSELVIRRNPEAFPDTYRVSAERIRRVVPKETNRFVTLTLLNTFTSQQDVTAFSDEGTAIISELVPIATDGGLENAQSEIYASISIKSESVSDVITGLSLLLKDAEDMDERQFHLHIWTLALLEDGKINDFVEVVDFFLSQTAPVDQPRFRMWAAYQCFNRGSLETADRWTREWPPGSEAAATPDLKVNWAVMRCHIMRRQGNRAEALVLAENASKIQIENDSTAAMLSVIRAKLLRDTGDVAGALEVLERDASIPEMRWPDLLQTLATTLARYGQYQAALGHSLEAFRIALDNRSTVSPEIFAGDVLYSQARLGLPLDNVCVEEILRHTALQFPSVYAIAMQAVLHAAPPADHEGWKIVEGAIAMASDILDSCLAQGDQWLGLQWITALLDGLLAGKPGIDGGKIYSALQTFMGPSTIDPGMAARVALLSLEGDVEHVRPLFSLLYSGQAARFGKSGDRRINVTQERATDEILSKIVKKVLSLPDSTQEDLRILADAARAPALRADAPTWVPDDAGLAEISSRAQPVVVVEWIRDVGSTVLITCLDPNGGVTKCLRVEAPDVNLIRLNARMRNRLSAWHDHRQGDAFANQDWISCELWLRDIVERNISPDSQLIIIRPPSHSSLPWHRAVLDLVGCSYEASWFGLRSSIMADSMVPIHSEGVAICPRENEDSRILAEMDQYIRRVTSGQSAASLQQISGIECTRESLAQLLNSSDMASLFMHGVANSESGVSLAVSADGKPPRPLKIDLEGASDPFSFGWRQMLAVDRSPSLILSVACGSATSAEVGWGDSAGVFGALRRRGLRSFVGPQWDVDPCAVAPLLLAMRSGVLEGVAIGEVYRKTLLDAEDSDVPPWSSYALSLEGNWQ